jgi:hypothetical protein
MLKTGLFQNKLAADSQILLIRLVLICESAAIAHYKKIFLFLHPNQKTADDITLVLEPAR